MHCLTDTIPGSMLLVSVTLQYPKIQNVEVTETNLADNDITLLRLSFYLNNKCHKIRFPSQVSLR